MKNSYVLLITSYNRYNRYIIFLLSAICLLHSVLFAQPIEIKALDLQNPTYPSAFNFTTGGYWDKTFNDTDFTFFKSQIFSFSHLIEGAGSSIYGAYWNGFTVCNSGDNANHSAQGWTDYQWGCMAGGGIKTDAQGNVMTDENGDVLVQEGLPYLVAYWQHMLEPEWWDLYWFKGYFLDEPTHSLQILLDEDKEYEAVGVYVNIHPWTYFVNLFGDGGSARPLNHQGDFIKLILHGLNHDGSENGKSVVHFLAKFENNQLIQNTKWEWVDLSSLGEIGGLYCKMESTINNYMGPLSPMYFCMDKLQVITKGETTFIPVTNIINVPDTAYVGVTLNLDGNVVPNNATNQTITWNVQSEGGTGANISDNKLSTTNAGTATITATIQNGIAVGENFAKDFTIHVVKCNQEALEDPNQSNLFIYSHQNLIYIKNESKNEYECVKIHDLTGRMVYQGKIHYTETVITLRVASGIYNITLYGRDAINRVSTKVVIMYNH